MEGGKILGQGTYGCVFTPPLLCNKSNYKVKKGEVGKITEAIDYVNEKRAYTVLNNVKGDYYVLLNPESECTPKNFDKQIDKDVGQCKFIKEYDNSAIIHFTMPYGGVSIRKVYTTFGTAPPFSILSFAKHILEGGVNLALKGYVHYDIHQDNILLMENTFKPRFIDFGMSFSSHSISETVLNERWKVYSPDYSPEPPEITCITGIRNGKEIKNVVREIYMQKPVLQEAEISIGLSRKNQVTQFIKFWKSSKVILEKDWVKFFKLYWTGFDAWGIGVVLLSILRMNYMFSLNQDKIKETNQVKNVIRKLLYMNPRARFDCLEALSELDPTNQILMSDAGKSWLKERSIIRTAM
jgi:serine/threonine protein kinase